MVRASVLVLLSICWSDVICSATEKSLLSFLLSREGVDTLPALVEVSWATPVLRPADSTNEGEHRKHGASPEVKLTDNSQSTEGWQPVGNALAGETSDTRIEGQVYGSYLIGGRMGVFSGCLVMMDGIGGSRSCDSRWTQLLDRMKLNGAWVAVINLHHCSLQSKLDNLRGHNVSGVLVSIDLIQVGEISLRVHETNIPVLLINARDTFKMAAGKDVRVTVRPDLFSIRLATDQQTGIVAMTIGWIALFLLFILFFCTFAHFQRFRRRLNNNRAMKQLINTSDPSVTRLPTLTLPPRDPRVTDLNCCVICLDTFAVGQVVRTLPCQ